MFEYFRRKQSSISIATSNGSLGGKGRTNSVAPVEEVSETCNSNGKK